MKKVVGLFGRELDLRAVRQPHYQPGLVLCSLNLKDKFVLFVRDTYDPTTFLAAGFNAGIDQGINRDRSFGQGGEGYAKRFGADFIDQASFKFFRDFAYAWLFSEDPRYYRFIEGSRKRRILHAVNHAFIARSDNNEPMFNFSELLGTASVAALGNLYHPGNQRGVGATSAEVAFYIGQDIGWDMLREFWPDIAHRMHLPFRDDPGQGNSYSNPTTK